MIFPKPCQIVTHNCIQTTLAFFINMRDGAEIENLLNKEFTNVCESFVDNKLSVYFREDKTKRFFSGRKETSQSLRYHTRTME